MQGIQMPFNKKETSRKEGIRLSVYGAKDGNQITARLDVEPDVKG